MKIYNRGKKKKSLYSKKDAKLPGTYWELFIDVIKQNWRTLICVGLITFVFFLPMLAVMFFRDYYAISISSSKLEIDEISALIITSKNVFNVGVSLCLLLACVGIAGCSKIMLLLSRGEGTFFFKDFNKGVKQNTKNNFVFFIIYAVLFYFSFLVINNFEPSFITFLPFVIVQVLYFPLLMINVETTSVYSWKIKDSFINAAFIYIKNFFIYILFASPFTLIILTNAIGNIFIKYIIIVLLLIIAYPFLTLGLRVYTNKVLDRDINKEHYPEIYKKGIYQPDNDEFVDNVVKKYYSLDSTFSSIKRDPYLGLYYRHLCNYMLDTPKVDRLLISDYNEPRLKEEIIDALNTLRILAHDKMIKFLPRKGYSVLGFRQKERAKVAIVLAGGGYNSVYTLGEDIPVSLDLYNKGFNVFSFSYPTKEEATLALDCLKEFIVFLFNNANKMNIDMEDYIVVGFSAAGHLVGCLGTDNLGLQINNIPLPKLLVLGYPVVTMGEYAETGSKNNLIGDNPSVENIDKYSLELHIDSSYPATFIWQCDKDNVVPFKNSLLIVEEFKKHGVKYIFETFDSELHGLASGKGSVAEGWIDRMYEFYKDIKNK